MNKKITYLLILSLLTGMITGCSGKVKNTSTEAKEPTEQKSSSTKTLMPTAQTAKTDSKETDDKDTPKGRYIEKEVKLPKQLTDGSLDLEPTTGIPEEDELLVRFAYDKKYKHFYRFAMNKEEHWKKEELEWAKASIPKNVSWVQQITTGGDGNGYLLYYTAKSSDTVIPHIIKQVSKNKGEEVKIVDFKKPDSNGRYPYPQSFRVDKDGTIYLLDSNQCTSIHPSTGKTEHTYKIADSVYTMLLTNDEIYLPDSKKQSVDCYDKTTGDFKTSYDFNSYDNFSQEYSADKNGQLILMIRDGIYTIQPNNSKWELILDGSLSALSDPTNGLVGIVPGDKNDYYFSLVGDKPKLYHAFYSEDASALPKNILTVYSLYNSNSVRQAISTYQSKHSDTKVAFRVVTSEKFEAQQDGFDTSDYINSLNTELLAGGGSDILILDDLPYESYIDKGILADLKEYVPTLTKENTLIPGVVSSSEKDGSIYALPTMMTLYTVDCNSEIEPTLTSLQAIDNYIHKKNAKDLFSAWSKEGFVEFVLNLESERLFQKDSLMSQKDMVQLFKNIKDIQENTDTQFATDQFEDQKTYSAFYDQIFKDKSTMMARKLYSTYASNGASEVHKKRNSKVTILNSQYDPELIVGINQNSNQKEAAGAFIDLLFSNEIQELPNNYMSLPTTLSALTKLRKYNDPNIGGGCGDYRFRYPDKNYRNIIADLCSSVTNPRNIPPALKKLYVPAITECLQKDSNPEQIANQLYNKISLYMAE